jgi:hypothetical protein
MAGGAVDHPKRFFLMQIYEDQLWESGAPASVTDGDVLNCHDRPVHFRALIQRRWGWPKKAAYAAADFLLSESEKSGRPAMLWIDNPHRDEQQTRIIENLGPDVLRDLFSGLARGGSRERHDTSHAIQSLRINFDGDAVEDSGLIKGILAAISNRLGCNMDELRAASYFDTGDQNIRITIMTTEFSPNGK